MHNSNLFSHIIQKIYGTNLFIHLGLLFDRFKVRNKRAELFHQSVFLPSFTNQHLNRFFSSRKSKHYINEIIDYIRNHNMDLQVCRSTFENYVFNVSSKNLTAGQWNELSMYLISLGLFIAGYYCRQHSYKSFLNNKYLYSVSYYGFFLSYLFDTGKWEHAKKFLKHYSFFLSSEQLIYFKLFFCNESNIGVNISKEYYDLINNKTIALIGPLDEVSDIDLESFDRIIRINVLQKKVKQSQRDLNKFRTDIIY